VDNKLIEIKTFKKSLRQLDYRQKLQIFGVFLASLVVLCVDLASVGSVMPLIEVLTKENSLAQYSDKFDLRKDLVILAFSSVIFLSLFARFLLNLYIHWITKLLCWRMSSRLFENMLSAPYPFFFTSRSEGLQRTILNEADHFVAVIIAFTSLYTNTIAFLAIGALAIWSFGAEAAIFAALAIFVIGVIYGLARNLVSKTGKVRFRAAEQRQYAVVSAIRGIREVIHYNVKVPLLREFDKQNALNARAQFTVAAVKMLPRFSIEITVFFIVIGWLFFLQRTDANIEDALPQIGLAAFVVYRVSPILQSIFASFTTVNYASQVVDNICDVNTFAIGSRLDTEVEARNSKKLTSMIEFKEVSFNYLPYGNPALVNLNFVIKKGESVAVMGETGSGKSTLIDLMLGLLTPTSGQVTIDGLPLETFGVEEWRTNIGYVPQDIFLINGSVVDNICFGKNKLDVDKDAISKAISASGVAKLISQTDINLDTEILNDGITFSGGQKQRIAIGRGLFKSNGVLIFDEASSALDSQTQRSVLSEICNQYKTATKIFVTHNPDVLDFCDKVIILKSANLSYFGSIRGAYENGELKHFKN
jgi:ABC-type bacteriocin/lantibiotic exporter with double-glycine peptidase domain